MDEYKKYRLLKDLPGLKAGAVFTYDHRANGYVYEGLNGFAGYSTEVVENSPDWFKTLAEEIKPEAWWAAHSE
jgi:hypothetical protein